MEFLDSWLCFGGRKWLAAVCNQQRFDARLQLLSCRHLRIDTFAPIVVQQYDDHDDDYDYWCYYFRYRYSHHYHCPATSPLLRRRQPLLLPPALPRCSHCPCHYDYD